MKFAISHSLKEDSRRKCYYFLCLFACFLVSLVSLVSKSIVTQGSLIFLMLSEKERGEMDIVFTPISNKRIEDNTPPKNFYYDYAFINYSKFYERTNKNNNNYDTSTIRTIFEGLTTNKNYNVSLLLINTTKEKEIELGRSYPYNKLNKGECIVHNSFKNLISNNKIEFKINLVKFLNDHILVNYYETNSEYKKFCDQIDTIPKTIILNCTVKNIIQDTYGKTSGDEKDIIFMENEYFFSYLSSFVNNKKLLSLFPNYKKILGETNPNHYGNQLIVNFPKNRINYYLESDYNQLVRNGVTYANEITKQIDTIYHMKVTMPVIKGLEQFKYGNVLLNMILNIIIFALFGLSLILIYSLLLITTETNAFEFGILRLIGNTKNNVILIVIMQCISFSVPGFILAFILHFQILKIINLSIKNYLHSNLDLGFTQNGFVISFIINFLGPIIAAIFPIRGILKKNIATSLNTMINKTSGMKIEIISLEKSELNNLIIFGVITFFYGASIYYFLPLSIISLNFGMLGMIFLFILIGIILGFVILSANIENLIQKFLTNILLFFSTSYTKILIMKNLTAHRTKNRKTSIMYSLSIGIFIMVSVGLDIIVQSTKKSYLNLKGSEITLSQNYFKPKDLIEPLKELYDKELIESFTFRTAEFSEVCFKSTIQVENIGKSLYYTTYLNGISPEYFSTTEKSDLKIAEQNETYNKYNPSEQLYLKDYIGKVGLSALFTFHFDLHINTDFYINLKNQNEEIKFITKPAFLLNGAAGIYVNSIPSSYWQRTNIISIPLFLDYLTKCTNYFSPSLKDMIDYNYDNVPIDFINLKLNDKKPIKESSEEIIKIFSNAKNINADIWLFENRRDRLDTISNIAFNIFYSVSSIVLFFCFFNLTASMTINLFAQKKEIAIMRSLGMKKKHVIFVFVSEAIILILTSSLIGTFIGSLISYTMGLQWEMFTYQNVQFNLKISNLVFVVLFSIFGGILSTILPAKKMLDTPIPQLIREI